MNPPLSALWFGSWSFLQKEAGRKVSSLCLVGNFVPLRAEEAVVDALNGSKDFGVISTVERRIAAKKDEHDHPYRPEVTSLVVLLGQN